jgi:hypothetical protein
MKDNVDAAVSILTARKDKGLFLDANVSAALGAEGKQEQQGETIPDASDVASAPLAVITDSVGRWEKGARNIPADVETVQRLLESAAQKLRAPELDPKGIDGKIARPPGKSNTAAAIEALQSRCNILVNGVIEPGGQTWQALMQAAGGT